MNDLVTRFWRNVPDRPEVGCWNWSASTKPSGHGQLRFNGKTVYAHRVSFELNVGPIPHGMVVRHKCDNPRCIRPTHLLLGSQRDNVHDAIERGRVRYVGRPGESNPNSKLTNVQRQEICQSSLGPKALALRFDVTPQTIWLVRRNGKLVEAA